MLTELRVENLLLIQKTELEFSPGFNVFTGETGHGKSLLLDALSLLFGAKGDSDLVRPGTEKALISARFALSDSEIVLALHDQFGVVFDDDVLVEARKKDHVDAELILSRNLPRQGRSRAYANGHPVALPTLRAMGEHLVDIHGQHQNQSLLRPATRLEILDRFAEADKEFEAYQEAWRKARELAEQLVDLRAAVRDRTQREQLYRFQLNELDEADLDAFPPHKLEEELKLLRGAESIREAAYFSAELLDGEDESATQLFARAVKRLSALPDAGTQIEALLTRLDSSLAETRDLAQELYALTEQAKSNPQRLEELEDLHTRWRLLERKHGRDIEGLRELRDELRQKLGELDHLDESSVALEKALDDAKAHLKRCAATLTRKRTKACRELERRTQKELPELGLKDARLEACLKPNEKSPREQSNEALKLLPSEFTATGAETLALLFSGNPDLPTKTLAECASGGELSRVMLALKGVLAKAGGADRLPVVIFDEIDTGVGGRLGAVLGRRLADLAGVRQVLCVTHLPQLAAFGVRQFKVEKGQRDGATGVQVFALSPKQRIDELALMMRGDAASAHTRKEAEEMLASAQGSPQKSAKSGKKNTRAARS